MRVVTAQQMRQIEEQAVRAGVSLEDVMRRAGGAVAAAVGPLGGPVLILAGPGNNGGDGLIAAHALRAMGVAATVYTVGRDTARTSVMQVRAEEDADQQRLSEFAQESSVIVDALLGTGQNRPPEGLLAAILDVVNHAGKYAHGIAIDIPTGVSTDTGAVPGAAFMADRTICIGLPKIGDVLYPGAAYAGKIEIADVGLPVPSTMAADVAAPDADEIARLLPRRDADSNKGSFGRVVFCGGSHNFLGAPALSAMASYRSGAGLVELAVIPSVQQSVAAHITEAVFQPLAAHAGYINSDAAATIEQTWRRADAFVFGPGMGLSDDTVELTRRVLASLPSARLHGTVIDADGLNALSRIDGWWESRFPLVVTPHPGEMSRLTGLSIEQIQGDRLAVAREHAEKWSAVVVLKGAGTVVASPQGQARINRTGGPNLATAGTGDVLSGIIGGLLAQGCTPFDAAVAGVYLHGRAGDIVGERLGNAGTVAGDLLPAIPLARQSILEEAGELQ
jgi:hydroxyethylthiazole kinase-like uncharacterized protein yjeF